MVDMKGSSMPPILALLISRLIASTSTTVILDLLLHSIRLWVGKKYRRKSFWRETEANSYKQGAHQAEDSIKDNTKYVK